MATWENDPNYTDDKDYWFTSYEENGLVGLKDQDNEIFIPAIYHNIEYDGDEDLRFDNFYFIVKYKGLYGLCRRQKEVLPCLYSSIRCVLHPSDNENNPIAAFEVTNEKGVKGIFAITEKHGSFWLTNLRHSSYIYDYKGNVHQGSWDYMIMATKADDGRQETYYYDKQFKKIPHYKWQKECNCREEFTPQENKKTGKRRFTNPTNSRFIK